MVFVGMKIFGQTLDASILDTIREEAAFDVSRSGLTRKVCGVLGKDAPEGSHISLCANVEEMGKGQLSEA